MTVEERLSRLEALVVQLVDQLQFAFPGKRMMQHMPITTPDFTGENRLGEGPVFDPANGHYTTRELSDEDTAAFVRTRVRIILAAIEVIRKDL